MAAASSSFLYFTIIALFIRETKPEIAPETFAPGEATGYRRVLRHYPFLAFCLLFALMLIVYFQMYSVLPVYLKDVQGVAESRFGFMITTAAAMVVFFQFPLARVIERFRRLPMMALAAFLIALGVGGVAISHTFPMFMLDMVILTIGELLFAPTSIALVADLAPETMRGTYMAVFGVSSGAASGLAPIIGGAINDYVGPIYVWRFMSLVGVAATVGFLLLGKVVASASRPPTPAPTFADPE